MNLQNMKTNFLYVVCMKYKNFKFEISTFD